MQMKTNDEIIEIIKRTVLDYLPDAEVLLFGSHARKMHLWIVIMIFY